MPRGRLSRLGLGVVYVLTAMACGSAMFQSLPSFSGARILPAASLVNPTPTPALGSPDEMLTPFAPFELPPAFATPVPTPTEVPPTATPEPTPLPTATPLVSLQDLARTPAARIRVLGHGIRLPEGFNAGVYAQGLDTVSYLAYAPDGVLFASLPGRGAVVALVPSADGTQANETVVFAEGLSDPTGVAFYGGHLYVAESNQVVRFAYTPGDLSVPSGPEVVVPYLPVGAGVATRVIGFGPDHKLYVAIGASCNACREVDYRRAAIMRYDPDGSNEELYAQGLRDVEGLCWYPNTHQLLATNCSRRRMGENLPPETIEYVFAGTNHGWPFCHAGTIPDPDLGWPGACEGVSPPFEQLPAHTAPRGLRVYTGEQFPQEYFGDIFVALYGSWERQVPVGYSIYRLDVQDGQVVGREEFATGWLVHGQHWGRPVDLIQAPDGSLLVSDDQAGAIYRIYYGG